MQGRLTRIRYQQLNARQKENYNSMKLSAVLADFGFVTIRLTDDWQGADCIAQHIDGATVLRVQLKSRLAFHKKYCGKNLHVAFTSAGSWFLYSHDELLAKVLEITSIGSTESWRERGGYSFSRIPKALLAALQEYKITS